MSSIEDRAKKEVVECLNKIPELDNPTIYGLLRDLMTLAWHRGYSARKEEETH